MLQPNSDRDVISRALSQFLSRSRIRHVEFAQATVAPPVLAYVTDFPRLSIPISGKHHMEIARDSRSTRITLARGDVVFAGRNCWNKPDWSTPVKVLTLLFGKTQIGVSLVSHDGQGDEPTKAFKTTISPFEGLAQHILSALTTLAVQPRQNPLECLLAESLLHVCKHLLADPTPTHLRKAARTFEALGLYVQENFQNPITRESVAKTFGLTPNHVSRLFRREGAMRFSDYLTLVRIDRAKFMLRQYNSPLKEVAANCGYHDLAYFCRVFRKATKTTPTEFRHKNR
ncbi:MAG: helix-turn-helix transcriptional regulator [Planctomycetes bacterium]|nr:helix-turn-helix transcriptional regulator [Planctomycetota bacterium]